MRGRWWGNLVSYEVGLFSGQASKRVERARAGGPLERSLARFLIELFGEKWLASFANCVTARICVDGVCMLGNDVRLVFVDSRAHKWRVLSWFGSLR